MEELLRTLVAFRTVSADHQANHEAIDFIAGFVVARGMHVERFASNGHESLIATTVAGRKTPKVMLAAHLDVVPAPEELFELRHENGRYYGRGVLDMKFAIAGYLQIIDDLRDELGNYDFGLMITTDEEVGGMNGVEKLVAEGYIPDVCLLPDGGENWQIQTSANGFTSFKLIARGVSGHGSRPWLTDNPITKLMACLDEIHNLFDPSPRPGVNTISVTNFQAGDGAFTQVPDVAEALVDVRSRTESQRKLLQTSIEAVCKKHDVELTYLVRGSAQDIDLTNPLIASYAQLIEQHAGVKVQGSHAVASGDARFYIPSNTPVISFYPTGGGHHSNDEWITDKSLEKFTTMTRAYLDQIARKNTKQS